MVSAIETREPQGVALQEIGLRLQPRLKRMAYRKAEAMFRRFPDLLGLKLDVKRQERGRSVDDFVAVARLVLPGYDRIVVKRGAELGSVISQTLEVSNRQLRRRSRLYRRMQKA